MVQFLAILLGAHKSKMDQRGASAVEYGLLVAGIAALVIAAVFLLGGTVRDMFTNVNGRIGNNGNPVGG